MTTIAQMSTWTEQPPYQTALEVLQTFRWSVIPLDEEKRPPKVGGTHPDGTPKRLAWKRFQTKFPSIGEVKNWHHRYNPDAWGVVTGAMSRLIILDFDGQKGAQTRQALDLDAHVQTGSGGAHVYFSHPGWYVPTLNSKTKLDLGKRWPGLDIRADGGYAAFCGRNTQGPYLWLRDPHLESLDVLPLDLREMLGLLHPPEASIVSSVETGINDDSDIGGTLFTRAMEMVKQEGCGRNDTGFWLVCQLRDNHYSKDAARKMMASYVEQVPTKNTKGKEEPYALQEALATLESAYRADARDPWEQSVHAEPKVASGGSGKGSGSGAGTSSPSPPDPGELPDIILVGEQLRDLTDQAVAAILQQESNKPTLFLQSSRLVRVGHNEMYRPVVTQMGIAEVKEVLTHVANFFRLKKVPGAEDDYIKVPCSPSKELAEQILARQTQKPYLPFPPLIAIVETPVIRPDGTILDYPGYDKQTKLYYAPQAGMEACKVPLQPTREECQAALDLLWEAFGEFSYVSDADRANTLGLLLTPIIRPAVKRHVPLALIDAPKQGTGKGLLSDGVSIIATGVSASILTLSDSDEELQKSITSLLIEGSTIITIDNITGRLQSKHLDAVLTSDMWKGRILGQSKMAQVPQRATWIATGNNIRVGGDLARRCYRIRLDPKTSRPWMRNNYKHPDLATWIMENRSGLTSALLTLARAWFAANCPHYDHIPTLGTFTSWAKIVGGILEYAGVQGFLSNLEKLYDEADEESAQWEAFLQSWYENLGDEWVKISDVVQWLQTEEEVAGSSPEVAGSSEQNSTFSVVDTLPETLQIALKDRPKSFSIRLGKALEKRIDTCFGKENLHLERGRDEHKKVSLWRVFAGSAGSSSSHARDENFFLNTGKEGKKNESRIDGKNSPHSPQQPEDEKLLENAENGSVGELAPLFNKHECPQIDQNQPPFQENLAQLPATSKEERERFDL